MCLKLLLVSSTTIDCYPIHLDQSLCFGTTLYVYICADGVEFFWSDNGVLLTAGDAQGKLLPKYFSRALKLRPTSKKTLQRASLNLDFKLRASHFTDATFVLCFREHPVTAVASEERSLGNTMGELCYRQFNGRKYTIAKETMADIDYDRTFTLL